MTASTFEIGLNSFGEVATDGDRTLDDAEVVRLLVEEARLAESSGIDVFSIGEHYRPGHVDSAVPVLLSAIATATERIRLGTSVTVLSTNDPVRLYHAFSTLDAVSNGRAQLVLGRASATESFPLFGYDLTAYEQLFEEKLDLFMRLQREEKVTWSGATRAPLVEQELRPRMPPGGIPTWIGVGGSPDSVLRAARYGLPLMLAVIGGRPQRFRGHVDLTTARSSRPDTLRSRSDSTPSGSSPTATKRRSRPGGGTGSRSSANSPRSADSTNRTGSATRPSWSTARSSSGPRRPSPARSPSRPGTFA
ncbi:F420-dependent glucose-6-phosphate dehydrogenase [Streptomyces viridochromogenes]